MSPFLQDHKTEDLRVPPLGLLGNSDNGIAVANGKTELTLVRKKFIIPLKYFAVAALA